MAGSKKVRTMKFLRRNASSLLKTSCNIDYAISHVAFAFELGGEA